MADLGFARNAPMPRGVAYDTSERRTRYPDDQLWLGEGDLRYLATKSGKARQGGQPLSDTEYGSAVDFDASIPARFAKRFDRLGHAVSGDAVTALAACARIQFRLRELMSVDGALDLASWEKTIDEVLDLAETVRR
jgi:hypothetical protein